MHRNQISHPLASFGLIFILVCVHGLFAADVPTSAPANRPGLHAQRRLAFIRANADGDAKAALDLLYVAKPADRTRIETSLVEPLALLNLQKSINTLFGDNAPRVPGVRRPFLPMSKKRSKRPRPVLASKP